MYKFCETRSSDLVSKITPSMSVFVLVSLSSYSTI